MWMIVEGRIAIVLETVVPVRDQIVIHVKGPIVRNMNVIHLHLRMNVNVKVSNANVKVRIVDVLVICVHVRIETIVNALILIMGVCVLKE